MCHQKDDSYIPHIPTHKTLQTSSVILQSSKSEDNGDEGTDTCDVSIASLSGDGDGCSGGVAGRCGEVGGRRV